MFQSIGECVTEDAAQHWNGQQEARVAGVNPVLMVWRQSAGGNDAVNVIVAEQVLTPGMEDGEESDLGAEVFWIGSHFQQGLGTGREQRS